MIAAAVVALLLGLLGAAAISGVLPVAVSKRADPGSLAQRNASLQPRLAQAARCTSCGVVETIRKKSTAWRITVRLDDGSVRTLSQPAAPPFAVGDRVRIVSGSGVERV